MAVAAIQILFTGAERPSARSRAMSSAQSSDAAAPGVFGMLAGQTFESGSAACSRYSGLTIEGTGTPARKSTTCWAARTGSAARLAGEYQAACGEGSTFGGERNWP